VVAPRTLVVEDDPDLLDTCVRLLEQGGHRCLAARSGGEAVALIDAERPGLVLTDWRLPALDGLAVARHARRASPPVPVVLTTAYPSAEVRRRAREVGGRAPGRGARALQAPAG
jgi:CheY-like chemotaxis protein